ncbi:MAG: hypothetical protein FGM32_10740 [Candidatus Kapabacteria bacterium]|nr:hypothetical protein [Candidatus Kapabacteria bacterium]
MRYVVLLLFVWSISCTLSISAAGDPVHEALEVVLQETAIRRGVDSYVIVPVHHTGCPGCVKEYLAGPDLLDECSTSGYRLVYIAPVNRRVQWSTIDHSNSYPVKTVPDVQRKLTKAIGSSPDSPKALVVSGMHYRIVAYDITAICAAMAELKKK